MKKSDIYEILIKILGLYVLIFKAIVALEELIYSIVVVNSMPAEYSNNYEGYGFYALYSEVINSLTLLVIFMLIAWFMIFKTSVIVNWIYKPADDEESIILTWNREQLYEMALVVTGCIIITWGLPEFIYDFKNYLRVSKNILSQPVEQSSMPLLMSSVRLAIGVVILLGAGKLSALMGKKETQMLSE